MNILGLHSFFLKFLPTQGLSLVLYTGTQILGLSPGRGMTDFCTSIFIVYIHIYLFKVFKKKGLYFYITELKFKDYD